MEQAWLGYAKRLQAIASTGLHFGTDDFDRERYVELASIATSMLADLGAVSVERIEGLVSDFGKGYATPKVDVRGALISDGGKILLVRERSDGLWTLPGGFAEVGVSPAQNVVREVREEVGLEVRVDTLFSVRHKAAHDYAPDVRDFYKMFFLCRLARERVAEQDLMRLIRRSTLETSDAGLFGRDALPPLSTGRVLARDIDDAYAARADRRRQVLFD